MGISVYPPASAAGKTLKVQTFTTEGANTFTLPSGYGPGNPLAVELLLVGAGGGAGTGNYQSSSDVMLPGGGGGGAVKKINASITANMTAHVGYKGYAPRGSRTYSGGATNNIYVGGNGGYTYFGNSTPKNLFLNPQLISFNNYSTEAQVFCGFSKTSSYAFNAAIRGNIHYTGSWSSSSSFRKSQPYSVKPSTNYCFSIYMRTPTTTTGQVIIYWYDSSNTYISATTGSSTSTPANTWTRVHAGGTSPSNAAYCVFRLLQPSGAVGDGYISNAMFEEGATTPSTYVDGDSAGYSWTGHPAGSVTILNSDTMYVASGGGGGGASFNESSSYASSWWYPGFPGASSGGGSMSITNITSVAAGGSGGGAGGHATIRKDNYWNYTTNTTSLRVDSKSPWWNTMAENGFGAIGQGFSSASQFVNIDATVPGMGIDGYGRGGYAQTTIKEQQIFDTRLVDTQAEIYPYVDAKANTGNGGNVSNFNIAAGAVTNYMLGGHGGSGLIVVKYWE